jgi:hypothetical protein
MNAQPGSHSVVLDLEPDELAAVQRLAEREGRSVPAILSVLLRIALEDLSDLTAAESAVSEGGEPVSLEAALKTFGLER